MLDDGLNIKGLNNKIGNELLCDNVMQLPKIDKVVINMGLGAADLKIIKGCTDVLSKISGQSACITKCRRSVSSFKTRKGTPMGCKVSLRKDYACNFLNKVVYIVLPNLRDFIGFSIKSIKDNGDFAFGLKDLSLFPEVDFGDLDRTRGLDVNIVVLNSSRRKTYIVLKAIGFIFYDDENF